MRYFAYGSNMSRPRLEQRIGEVRVETTATLPGHRLAFTKVGRDGTGKCCFENADGEDRVRGVVFDLGDRQLAALDRAEGLGFGYQRLRVGVAAGGETLEAVTYAATCRDSSLRPFSWYLKHVLYGAIEAALEATYVAAIRRIPVLEDPDRSREARELSVYDGGLDDPCSTTRSRHFGWRARSTPLI